MDKNNKYDVLEFQNYIDIGKTHEIIMNNVEEKFYSNNSFKTTYDIKEYIEYEVKKYMKLDNIYDSSRLNSGLAFPIGISVDCIAAHNTPHKSKNNELIDEKSLVKVDFGLHSLGRIIDSARTMTKNEKYIPLQNASKEALNIAIKNSGPDVLLCEIGSKIEEVINSYEITDKNKTHQLVPVYELCGHNLSVYKVHNNKAVPNIKFPKYRERMKTNEVFAIEPFVTWESNVCEYLKKEKDSDFKNLNHYVIQWNYTHNLKDYFKKEDKEPENSMKKILKDIYKSNYTLPFSPFDYDYNFPVYSYYNKSYILELPVIKTMNPCAQYEKTIGITDNSVIVF